MTDWLPWDRREIFHDEIASYPQNDYFPLTEKGEGAQAAEEKEEKHAGDV
ncbi:MAG: hypothetical protein GX167_08100 [Firmicutes bacterium]|jgi:hypothetical protein|nr:hypothetical protein [Bacillota bacterium]HHX73835.1 hypothetical protein [Bacillota bacterium]